MRTIDTPRPNPAATDLESTESAITEMTFHSLIATRPQGDNWRDDAVCKGKTELFFAPKAERPQARTRREKEARALCDVCPVATACRAWARTNHEYGYWGGESEDERHLLGYHVMAPIGIRRRTGETTPAFLETA